MPERRPPDLMALQAPRAAGRRLLRLADVPVALGRLAALGQWPASAGFEPLAAMNGERPVDPSEPAGGDAPGDASGHASGHAAALRRGTRRPAPRLQPTTSEQRATPGLPAASVVATRAPALAPGAHSTRRPAPLPDPREVVAVMEALLQRPRRSTALPSLPPMGAAAQPLAPLPAAHTAATLLGALLKATQQRPAQAERPHPTLPGRSSPTLEAARQPSREEPALAARQPASAAPPVLDLATALQRSRPVLPTSAPASPGHDVLAPSDLAPRAASRLLSAAVASAPSSQHLAPTASEADGDDLLDAITRGLVDQAWLRGVNLG